MVLLFLFLMVVWPPRLLADKLPADKLPNAATPPRGKTVGFYLARGGRLLETGNYLQAIAYLDLALKAPRKGVKPAVIQLAEILRRSAGIYQEARLLRDANQSEAAVAKYKEIININPADPRPVEFIVEIYDLLTEAAEKQQKYLEAARLYEDWLKYAPQNEFPRNGLLKNLKAAAVAATARGDQDSAVALYHKLTLLDPTDRASEEFVRSIEKEQVLNKALGFLQRNELEQAIKEISSALSLYPGEAKLVEGLRLARGRRELAQADALMKANRYHEAVRFYNQALQFLPEAEQMINTRINEIKVRTGKDYQSDGVLHARASINGPVRIRIVGNQLTYLEGKDNANIKLGLESLPARPYGVKIERLEGDAMVQVVETPYRGNNYATTLLLTPKNERALIFDLHWELLKSGRVDWRGKINGSTTLRLQGPFIDTIGDAGEVSANCDPVPHQLYTLIITKLQGNSSVNVRVIEKPSASNDYATNIEITGDKQLVELAIEWNIVQ